MTSWPHLCTIGDWINLYSWILISLYLDITQSQSETHVSWSYFFLSQPNATPIFFHQIQYMYLIKGELFVLPLSTLKRRFPSEIQFYIIIIIPNVKGRVSWYFDFYVFSKDKILTHLTPPPPPKISLPILWIFIPNVDRGRDIFTPSFLTKF